MRRTLCLIVFCLLLTSGHVYADFESEVIDLVNAERAAQGLHPLGVDHNLVTAARDHSEDMGLQGYFSHTSLDGRTVPDRITAADAGLSQIVEEGETVTLDASLSSDPNDAVIAYEWIQTSGPQVWLSDENAVKPTFVAAPITEDATVVFQLTVYDSGGFSDSDTVEKTIKENGIIEDPSGPGVAAADSTSPDTGSNGGGPGGCFIDILIKNLR